MRLWRHVRTAYLPAPASLGCNLSAAGSLAPKSVGSPQSLNPQAPLLSVHFSVCKLVFFVPVSCVPFAVQLNPETLGALEDAAASFHIDDDATNGNDDISTITQSTVWLEPGPATPTSDAHGRLLHSSSLTDPVMVRNTDCILLLHPSALVLHHPRIQEACCGPPCVPSSWTKRHLISVAHQCCAPSPLLRADRR